MPPRDRRTSDLHAIHPAASAPRPEALTAPGKSKKISVSIDPDVTDAAKNAWWATRQESGLTFSGFVEQAMAEHVAREAKRQGVEGFPKRPTERLPAGRPVQ